MWNCFSPFGPVIITKDIHLFFLILSIAIIQPLQAQNLIPNPGFEAFERDSVFDWKQPPKPHYHFKIDITENGLAHSGKGYNGICMTNFEDIAQINEVLHIKLNDTLLKGQEYIIGMHLRMHYAEMINPKQLEEIQWYFSDQPDNIKSSSLASKCKPQLIPFKIDLDSTWNNWKSMEQKITATGNYQYLTIGYLQEPDKKPEQAASADSSSTLIKSQPEHKQINPKEREKEKEKTRLEIKNASKDNFTPFKVLYYFDDLYAIPVKEQPFQLLNPANKKGLKAGQVISLDKVLFENNKTEYLNTSLEQLDSLLKLLIDVPAIHIQIIGHTDDRGNENFNQKLSEKRAKAIVDFLIFKGVEKTRLSYKGNGSTTPITSNETEEGREKNRRVEVLIIQNK